MHLQCFTPTRYVKGVATRTYEHEDRYLICSKLLWERLLVLCGLYYACPSNICFSDNFFFSTCDVSLKKKKKKDTHTERLP